MAVSFQIFFIYKEKLFFEANTCVGFFWRHLIMSEVSTLAWFLKFFFLFFPNFFLLFKGIILRVQVYFF